MPILRSSVRRTKLVSTRARMWRGFRIAGVVAMAGAATLLSGVLIWNLMHRPPHL